MADRPLRDVLMTAVDDPNSERLRRLAEGTLPEEESAQLRADAQRDPALAARLELYAPLDERTMARLDETAGATRTRRPRLGWTTGAVALAAGLAGLFILGISAEDSVPVVAAHSVQVEGGLASAFREVQRDVLGSNDSGPLRLTFGEVALRWRVAPEVRTSAGTRLTVDARVDGAWRRMPWPIERTEAGVFLIEGTVAALFAGFDRADRLRFVVAPATVEVALSGPLPTAAWHVERDLTFDRQ